MTKNDETAQLTYNEAAGQVFEYILNEVDGKSSENGETNLESRVELALSLAENRHKAAESLLDRAVDWVELEIAAKQKADKKDCGIQVAKLLVNAGKLAQILSKDLEQAQE